MAELTAILAVMLDVAWPDDDHRIAGSAKIGPHQLRTLERRTASPGPASMVHVIGLLGSERIEATELVQGGDLLVNRVGDVVLGEKLADRPLLAFCARTVV